MSGYCTKLYLLGHTGTVLIKMLSPITAGDCTTTILPKFHVTMMIRKDFISEKLKNSELTLKVLVATIDAQWEGMGDVGSARYEPALLPPCPTIRVLSYSN